MRNGGEACTAANRFHVHESVAGEFAAQLADRLGAMKVGRGTDDGVQLGPLIDAVQRDKVAELVGDAVGKGATCLTGGKAIDGAGYFYEPTVLTEIPDDAELLREEIFGPVAPVKSFATDEEAIAAANDTEYGLVAYVYTRDLDRAFEVDRVAGDRDGRPQPGTRLLRRRPVRRHQGVGLRARGRSRGNRGVPGDEVRRYGAPEPAAISP